MQTKLRLLTASDTRVMMFRFMMEKIVFGTANKLVIGLEKPNLRKEIWR